MLVRLHPGLDLSRTQGTECPAAYFNAKKNQFIPPQDPLCEIMGPKISQIHQMFTHCALWLLLIRAG